MAAVPFEFDVAETGRSLAGYRWRAKSGAVGIVQICHGVSEHSGRYDSVARSLSGIGFEVLAFDFAGHGGSVRSAGMHGDLGDQGFNGLLSDAYEFRRSVIGKSDLPIYILGHSLGSFIAQCLLVDHSDEFDGAVLSGSSALDLMLADLRSDRRTFDSRGLNIGFDSRTGFEWLSRDEAEVDSYVEDPWCGFDLPFGEPRGLFKHAGRLSDVQNLRRIDSDFPILLLSGSADPLSRGGQYVDTLVDRYRRAGLVDVESLRYAGARHEVFHEINRQAVFNDLNNWLVSHTLNENNC